MTPTPEECHKDACTSADQQFSRIVRRWATEPLGRFDEQSSNHERLRRALEFLIQPILMQSPDSSVHEFWSDGIEIIEFSHSPMTYYFGGACVFSDRNSNAMWLAPFEMNINYELNELDRPRSVELKLGHRDPNDRLSRLYPSGRGGYRLYAMSHCLFGNRPKNNHDWAVYVNLLTYNGG